MSEAAMLADPQPMPGAPAGGFERFHQRLRDLSRRQLRCLMRAADGHEPLHPVVAVARLAELELRRRAVRGPRAVERRAALRRLLAREAEAAAERFERVYTDPAELEVLCDALGAHVADLDELADAEAGVGWALLNLLTVAARLSRCGEADGGGLSRAERSPPLGSPLAVWPLVGSLSANAPPRLKRRCRGRAR